MIPSDVEIDQDYWFEGEACWFYHGSRMRNRQPMVPDPEGGGNRCSNRVLYEREYGEIPPHRMLLRRCSTVACCNPRHYTISQRAEGKPHKKRVLQFQRDWLTPEVEQEFDDPGHEVHTYQALVLKPLRALKGLHESEGFVKWEQGWYEALVLLTRSRATIAEVMYLMRCTKTEVANGVRKARRTPSVMRLTRLDSTKLFGTDICGPPQVPWADELARFLRGYSADVRLYIEGELLGRGSSQGGAAAPRGMMDLSYNRQARREFDNLLIDYGKERERALFHAHLRKLGINDDTL